MTLRMMARSRNAIVSARTVPEIPARLAGFGLATSGAGTPPSTAEFIRNEQAKWRALAVELKIEPQ